MKINYRCKLCWILWLATLFVLSENNLYGISTSCEVKDCLTNALENRTEDENLLQVNFSFPETVKAGQVFTFEFLIAKEGDHSIGGKFQFTWPGGFTPMVSDNPKVKCKIDKNRIYVEWDSQTFPKDIRISYPVQVSNLSSGVYPLLSTLTFLGGLQIEKNAKIRVDGADTQAMSEKTILAPAENYHIRMDYPTDAEFGGQFNLSIHLQKGNSTGPALLKLSLPPSSDVEVLNHDDFEYNKYSGKMIMKWKNLPESPSFSINFQIIPIINTKAVYPISAEFFIGEKLTATYLNSIYLADKILQVKDRNADKIKSENDVRKADSVKLYAEMDELLNKWKDATKIITIETGQTKNIPETEKTKVSQSIEPVKDNKTNSGNINKPELLIEQKSGTNTVNFEGTKEESLIVGGKTSDDSPKPVILTTNSTLENVQKQQVQPDTYTEGVKVYRVQIAASKTILPGTKQFVQSLGFFETIIEDYDGTWYRYFVGEFSQISEAKDFNKKLIEKGIIDSFVVAFIDGKKVPTN